MALQCEVTKFTRRLDRKKNKL